MELFIAILIYFGMVTPNSTATLTNADQQFLVNSNQQLINTTLQDPVLMQVITPVAIDRLED
ncbi:MAG: hypothetical protein HYX66_05825 [Ignavibacteria bacterium]|nr:hypothetical protein [Ignavibacteria bacterium]